MGLLELRLHAWLAQRQAAAPGCSARLGWLIRHSSPHPSAAALASADAPAAASCSGGRRPVAGVRRRGGCWQCCRIDKAWSHAPTDR